MLEASQIRIGGRLFPRAAKAPLLVIGLVAAIWTACFWFPQSWERLGMAPGMVAGNQVFLDLNGMLVAGEAAQLGLNPFLPNPLDTFHRPHVYSEWWLVTGRLGWTRQDARWLGPVLDGLMLVAGVLLAWPVGKRQSALLVAALVSPALLMAVNRCNNDLVAFVIMCGAFALLRRSRGWPRVAGIALLALAAVLKYYPLAAAVVLLDARTRREWLGWVAAYAVVVVVAWPGLQPALHSAAKYRPSPEWLYAFGAPVIFRDFSLTPPPMWLLLGGVLAVAGWTAYREMKRSSSAAPAGAPEREFAAGAALVIGCFVLGSSYAYKLIFALWLLPWLWRVTASGLEDRWRKATLGLLFAVLWLEGGMTVILNVLIAPAHGSVAVNLMKVNMCVSQLLAWALILCLLRGLLIYIGHQVARLGHAPTRGTMAPVA